MLYSLLVFMSLVSSQGFQNVARKRAFCNGENVICYSSTFRVAVPIEDSAPHMLNESNICDLNKQMVTK